MVIISSKHTFCVFNHIYYFFLQYEKLDSVYKFVLIVIYIIMGIIEAGRLYLGYTGNLQEKVRFKVFL